ncbi:MAG: CTP synthase [Candidatus Babeliales bacterium]|nr:CTP synthase [Candidatus Babeliales bacterium]
MTKFVVVAGGVISGVGKGVATASLGKILKEHGYSVTLIKIDPYINCDAGTLRPTEHGEVWVTDDGGEIDQDLGTYERFMNAPMPKKNNITTGQIYKAVIDRERAGGYLGQTVQFVPHIIDEVKRRILDASKDHEIAIIEIGGTVGDYENVPFLFTLKGLEREIGAINMAYILVTYLPIPDSIHEMKTKPTQQAIRLLGQEGIQPDFILCRAKYPLDMQRKKKIEEFANIKPEHVISAPDIDTIYQIPLNFEREELGQKVLQHFGLKSRQTPDWSAWQKLVAAIQKPERTITIAIVGKYLTSGDYSMTDSYVSIYQALTHAGAQQNCGVMIKWLDAQIFETDPSSCDQLKAVDGVIIPGGFGASGVEGKMKVIEYVRTHNIPYLGLCYGMQLAAVEFARNVCGMADAHTTEVNKDTTHPIIDILPLQKSLLDASDYGGTMRLGAYNATLQKGSRVEQLYKAATVVHDGSMEVSERHRHRYEMNPLYVAALADKGLVFSGVHQRNDGTQLMEYVELPEHKFFVATQAHPEFNSRFELPNPLFAGFVKASMG